MSKNNLIRKSDKKFIRTEKARIRRQFFDPKKQEEMISELYKRFDRKTDNDKMKDGGQKVEAPLNPKHETLNPKQISKSKSKKSSKVKVKSEK